METALIVAMAYWAIFVLDESFSWQALVRPIVTGPIIGLVLGDLQTGAIMGGLIEAIFLGIVSVGGGAPADAFGSTIICTTFVIRGGIPMEAGLALAFPIGTLTARISQLVLPMHAYLVRVFEKFAENGESKKFVTLQQAYRFCFSRLFHSITIFLAIWFGAERVQSVFDYLPTFVLDGLGVAGGMLPAVGLGILTSMILNKRQGAFLFIGFALSAYLDLGTMAVAILAGAVAVIVFFNDAELQSKLGASKTKEIGEDFF